MGMTFEDKLFVETEKAFLKDLATLEKPVKELERTYNGYKDWDEEEALYVLTREHVITVLKKFLEHDVSGSDLYWWAETIIYSPTLDYQHEYRDIIAHILATLHTSGEMNEFASRKEAEEYIRQLNAP